MLRREIWMANLDPTEGSEQAGLRPVLIISGNIMNSKSGLVIVCPLTSKVKNFAGDVILSPNDENGLQTESEILTFQVRTISASRMIHRLGIVKEDVHKSVLKNLIKICTY